MLWLWAWQTSALAPAADSAESHWLTSARLRPAQAASVGAIYGLRHPRGRRGSGRLDHHREVRRARRRLGCPRRHDPHRRAAHYPLRRCRCGAGRRANRSVCENFMSEFCLFPASFGSWTRPAPDMGQWRCSRSAERLPSRCSTLWTVAWVRHFSLSHVLREVFSFSLIFGQLRTRRSPSPCVRRQSCSSAGGGNGRSGMLTTARLSRLR